MLTRTASGVSSASIIWASVDLPAPGAPVIPRKLRCPGLISRRAAAISSGRLSARLLMASTLTLSASPVWPARVRRAAVANTHSALGALAGGTGALTIRATVEKTGTRRLRNVVQVSATPLEPQERFLFEVTRATADPSERLPVTIEVPLQRKPTRRRRQESGCLGCPS